MDWFGLLVFGGTLAVAAATPGPGVAAIVARVLARGPAGAVAFTAGLATGDLVWLTLAILGVAVLAKTFALVFLVLKYLGAAYLLYLAWKIWRAPVTEDAGPVEPQAARPLRMYLAGLAVNLGNPKVVVFYLALLPNLIDVSAVTAASFAAIVATTVLVLAIVFGGYVLLAGQARSLFTSPSAVRRMHRVSGGVMAGAALAIATR